MESNNFPGNENPDEFSNQQNSKKPLILIGVLLVAVVAFAATTYFFVQQSNEEGGPLVEGNPVDRHPELNLVPELNFNEAYIAGRDHHDRGEYEQALEQFEAAAEVSTALNEKMLSDFMLANTYLQLERYQESTQMFIAFLENPEYVEASPSLKADAVEWIAMSLLTDPSPEHFSLVFDQTAMFADLKAPADAAPSQFDVSVLNLLRFGADTYYSTAPLELRIANSILNNNVKLMFKLHEQCVTPLNKPFNICVEHMLGEGVFTEEELLTRKEVADEVARRLQRAELDLARLKNIEAEGAYARALAKKARVMLKGVYFGVASVSNAEKAMQEALSYYQEIGNVEGELTMRVEYATLLTLMTPNPTPEEKGEIAQIVRPIYADSKFDDASYLKMLGAAYESELREHSVLQGMVLRSNANIAMYDPEYKQFLEQLGWDFEHEIITSKLLIGQ